MLDPRALSGLVSAAASVGSCTCREPGEHRERVAELAELDAAAGARRRDDFIRGRVAARRALGELGVRQQPIPIGAWHQPLWPEGVVGSISHAAGAGVAVAARVTDLRGIGVDVEARDRRLSLRAASRVLTRAERWALDEPQQLPWPLVLFCVKEAAFKAVFQAYGRRLVPGDLAFERPSTAGPNGNLECEMGIPLRPIRARYALIRRFLVTCVEVAREDPPPGPRPKTPSSPQGETATGKAT
jgi:4'-phosphopantetheinyl transferase EntD